MLPNLNTIKGGMMVWVRFLVTIFMTVILVWPQAALACSTFQIQKQGQVYFGRNYDWMVGEALIIINKRGTKKPPYVRPTDKGRPMEWTAKYGSLTFNQYGRELPTGGMNEAGLVVEAMALHNTKYPLQDERPYLAITAVWKQYVLDNFATVAEALAAIKGVRIIPPKLGLGEHYLISDAKGDCAVVEYLDGKLVVHHGRGLPVRALTNNTYEESLKHFELDTLPPFQRSKSIARFKTAAKMARAYEADPKQPPLDYAFMVLKKMSKENTQWSIVYDQNNRRVYLHTKNNSKLRMIDLNKFNFSCGKPVMILNIDAAPKDDVTREFRPYTLAANRELVMGSFAKTPYLKVVPKNALERLAAFPKGCKCVSP
jgi:penicillin V acylase-like amidase (Ntn superfamily)